MSRARSEPERRRWARLPLAIPVFVRSCDEQGKKSLEFATALNVSAGGMLVAVRRILASRRIHLEIPIAPVTAMAFQPQVSRSLHARALRTTPVEGFYLLGLKFLRPLLRAKDSNGTRRRKAPSAV